ncbi:MAG: hypothetical protein IJ011_09855 [Clostridia bacterium]|nr:hypothetical protein [Clostridia bacterium]
MKKIIKKLSIILSLFLCATLCVTLFSACGDGDRSAPTAATSDEEEPPTVLEESDDMGEDYIDSFVFFGESTTYHLKSRGVLSGGRDTAQVLADESGTAILDSETANMKVIHPESGELVSFGEAIKRKRPEYLLLTFGLNGAVGKVKRGEEYFKSCYKKLIDTARSSSPDTKIILGSCYPVAENMDMSGYSVTLDGLNERIETLNGWALELCTEEGLRYLNVNEILTDSNGRLKLEYQAGDGHHLTRDAYIKIIEYIRTHGYK